LKKNLYFNKVMTIKIALSSVSKQDIADILIHYNNIKPQNSGFLEDLVCKEGGFRIAPQECKTSLNKSDPVAMHFCTRNNERARELRWNSKKYLVSYFNRPGFSKEEEILLFKVMRFVLGKENVSYYETYGDAKTDSPSIKENLLIKKFEERDVSCRLISPLDHIYRRLPI